MRISIFVLLFLSSPASWAQLEKEAILKPINELFEGMKEADTAKIHNAFGKQVVFKIVVTGKENRSDAKQIELQEFLLSIAKPHKEPLNEIIWEPTVQRDQGFAQVWAKYAFYRGKVFSHCGVDAFQLLRQESGWKIISLIYTSNKTDCNIPKEIADKFK